MKHMLQLKTFACLFLACLSLSSFAQQKANILIKKNLNGDVEVIEQEVEIQSGDDLEKILQELNVLDEFGNLAEGQAFEITVRKLDKQDQVQEYDISYFPEPDNHKKAFLGVQIKDASEVGMETGAYISEIIPNSAAYNSELQEGDVITKINKTDISNYEELIAAILQHNPGDEIKIHFIREGKSSKTKIALGEKEQTSERWLFNYPNKSKNACSTPEPWAFNEDISFTQKAFLGVTPGEIVEKGVAIGSVISPSAAEEAGLQAGDVLLKFAGSEVNNFKELSTLIQSSIIGQNVELVVLRGNNEMVLQATLGERNQGNFNGLEFFQDYEGVDEEGTHFFEFELENAELTEELQTLFDGLSELELELNDMKIELDESDLNSDEFLKSIQEISSKLQSEIEGLSTQRPHGYEVSSEINMSITLDEITPDEAAVINQQAQEKLRLENDLAMEKISFFPNPSSGQFVLSFDLPSTENVRIMIFNGKGETVYNEQLTQFTGTYRNTIDLSAFANGAYFMQIIQGENTYSKKLIKGE